MEAHHARHDVPAAGNGAASIPVPADPPPEASSVTVSRERVGCLTVPPGLSTCGRASAQPGRSGPKAGAAPRAEPGSPPGGAERSRVLEPVEKVVTQWDSGLGWRVRSPCFCDLARLVRGPLKCLGHLVGVIGA